MSKSKFPNSVDECVRVLEEYKAKGHYYHPSNFAMTQPEIETLYERGFIMYSWGSVPVSFVKKEHASEHTPPMVLQRHAYEDFPEETPVLYQLEFERVGPEIDEQKLHKALNERNVKMQPGGWVQSTYSLELEQAIKLYLELDRLMPGMLVKPSAKPRK